MSQGDFTVRERAQTTGSAVTEHYKEAALSADKVLFTES